MASDETLTKLLEIGGSRKETAFKTSDTSLMQMLATMSLKVGGITDVYGVNAKYIPHEAVNFRTITDGQNRMLVELYKKYDAGINRHGASILIGMRLLKDESINQLVEVKDNQRVIIGVC